MKLPAHHRNHVAPSALFGCLGREPGPLAQAIAFARLRRLSLARSSKMKANYDFSTAVKNPYLKRIVVSVKIENARDVSKGFVCDSFVDTSASLMVLPAAWKDRLGDLESTRTIEVKTSILGTLRCEVCGPVRIQIEGFRPIFNEVAFVEMKPADGEYEPLIGYIVLEQSQAAVDMLGHRLVPIKHMDLK
jgi:hypothetical protein